MLERFLSSAPNPEAGSFVGRAMWCGVEVRVELCGADEARLRLAAGAAETVFAAQHEWDARLKQCAVDQLLSLKNTTWLDEDDEAVLADDFIARLTLMSVHVDDEGGFIFWWDDGDLFWGHTVEVSGNLAHSVLRAEIVG
jgi:hypothetical protein